MSNPALSTQVFEITNLHVGILESFPPQYEVTVRGTVTSAGWTNPQLRPYTYVQAPPDGVYDFDFVATPPQGVATQVITPIRLKVVLPGEGINGIRVHAAQNSKEAIMNPTGAQTA
jgi:hypothetical protein